MGSSPARSAFPPTRPGPCRACSATPTSRSSPSATVGYGDVSPVTALAGTLAWIEAVTGQLYLAITVARLVALSLADSSTSRV